MVYVLKSRIGEEDSNLQEFPNAKAAAAAAWELCDEHQLDMPSDEWTFEHPQYGEQSCYNMMVPKGDDWEPNRAFINFMTNQAERNGSVQIDGGDSEYIRIYSEK
uniref:Uncharacterized protein n=1 Tax=Chaetoceros debilis TaxID=122233 RepID=A0A7S3QJ24_9STRA|mmetsp:Transcript_21229/g.32254  ORF Transcript_21229/g.32254 Transcript_21229/m.32254 type:complete len:105 (-) Transcript_21229:75-389(-)